ncbi:hypothetical protein HYE67_005527 [Fusarium culmorum]|nr:hypothetical protein HYE67_005527 [Fusarium culmorum]
MAEQLRLQGCKEKFQTAYDAAVSQKEESEKQWKEEKEMGMHGQEFDQWCHMNAPAYSAVLSQYQGAKAAYETSLHAVDEQAAKAWREKVIQASIRPNGSVDSNTLIAPDA